MLNVDQVYEIRRKVLVEGVGVRRVARAFGVSRNTVRKYLSEAEPRRKTSRPRRRPVREVVEARLEALIEEWTPRTAGKQRLTAARLHEELRHEGFAVGRTLVQELVRERRRRAAEVYVPLVHRPGDEAQVDFFDVRVDVVRVDVGGHDSHDTHSTALALDRTRAVTTTRRRSGSGGNLLV